jgi:hypothetical protein
MVGAENDAMTEARRAERVRMARRDARLRVARSRKGIAMDDVE